MIFARPLFAALLALGIFAGTAVAGTNDAPPLSKGQTVYASAYSNVFSGPKGIRLDLSTILSIRNTDMRNPIVVTAVDYYDTAGKLLRRHIQAPVHLPPLATKYVHTKENETAGGPGANFIVRWHASRPVNQPIVETVMIGTRGGQGISFVTPGQVLRD